MKRIYLLILPIVLLWSCDNFLDVEPKGKAIPSTVEDFDLMLQTSAFSLGNSIYMDPDVYIPGDAFNSLGITQRTAYKWSENQYEMTDPDKDWSSLYEKLYICNQIIENVDGASTDDEMLRGKVKGQAHAQRAHIYFWLVNMYAKHYNESTMETDLAVPMKVKNDLAEKLPRATVAEIYELIESDLEIAGTLVPDREEIKKNFRASKISVNALRAKIELYKGNFSSALTHATSVIGAWGNEFKDLNNFTSYQDYISSNAPELLYYSAPEFIWYVGADLFPQDGGASIYLTDELENLYTEDDLRYQYWTKDLDQNGNPYPGNGRRYVNWYYKCITASINEMYLVRAECYARGGNATDVQKAMDDVNTLRTYRLKSGTDFELSANTSAEALNIVKEERRREFVATGLNWFDQKRYHAYGDAVPTYTRTIDGTTHTLAPGSNRYMMAIPEYVRAFNPNLEQNPR
jgi:hypothetical protein